jgi:flagellar biosynthesis component FlhA
MIIEKVFNVNEEKNIREVIENLPVMGCIKKFTSYVNTNTSEQVNPDMSELERKLIKKLYNDISKIYTNVQTDLVYSKMSPEELVKELQSMLVSNYPLENEETEYILERFENYDDSELHGFIKQTMSDYLDAIIEEATRTEKDKTIISLKNQFKTNQDSVKNYQDGIKKRTEENAIIADRLRNEFGVEV